MSAPGNRPSGGRTQRTTKPFITASAAFESVEQANPTSLSGEYPIPAATVRRQNRRMKHCIFLASLFLGICVFGQKQTWQDRCFNNPSAPYCQGRDFAVKPAAKEKAPSGVIRTTFPSIQNGGPSYRGSGVPTTGIIDAVTSSMNWKFVDPSSDVLTGINVRALAGSELARRLIASLAAQADIQQAEVSKLFEKLSEVDRIIVSVRNTEVVAFVIGQVPDPIAQQGSMALPDAGLKAVQVSKNAMLVGHVNAVDQALARIAEQGPPSDLARLGETKMNQGAEFWAVGRSSFVLPEAASAGAAWSTLTIWIRDAVTTEFAFDLAGPPSQAVLRDAQAKLGTFWVQGNTILTRTSLSGDQVTAEFSKMAAGPVGQQLSLLVAAAQFTPGRDPNAPKRRPVIVGLDDSRD
jgi:hypothetical protein